MFDYDDNDRGYMRCIDHHHCQEKAKEKMTGLVLGYFAGHPGYGALPGNA
jgi:hypothetical protein